MANRSTRNKLRWQAQKTAESLDRALEHLKYLDELAAGQSSYVNESLPLLVTGVTKVQEAVNIFREHL